MLDDAFAHHVWATVRLIDACIPLSAEQLATDVPGAYGSTLETFRHLIDGDGFYLYGITGDRAHRCLGVRQAGRAQRRVDAG
jgi:uncharacterized damage-inducible protein DinB